MEYLTLNNGVPMPLIGFGTFMLGGETCTEAVTAAIESGYRMIDTAEAYGNEKEVGEGIRRSGIDRWELFLVTKVNFKSYEHAEQTVMQSPENLQTDYRTLPLSADAISVLMQQRRKTGNSEWVFPSPTGGPMSPDSVLHMLQRVLKRAGLPRIRFHDLRHTFATMALQNGVDVKTVSSMLGHYSAGFTLDTYAHVTTDAQLKAAQTMGNILSRAV